MKTTVLQISLLLVAWSHGCASPDGVRGPVGERAGAAVDVTGRWEVSIFVDGGTITGLAILSQSGDRVAGSMGPNEENLHPLEGVVDGARIVLTMRPGPGVTTAFDTGLLTVDGDALKGTVEGGRADQGVIELVRLPE
jgi:hypothetical protein